MVVPGQFRVDDDLPGAGAVRLDNGFDAEQPIQKQRNVDSCSQP